MKVDAFLLSLKFWTGRWGAGEEEGEEEEGAVFVLAVEEALEAGLAV